MTIDEPLGNERPMNTVLASQAEPLTPRTIFATDLLALEAVLVEELDRLSIAASGPLKFPMLANQLLRHGAKLAYALRGAARLVAANAPDGVLLPTTRTESALPGHGFGVALPEADEPKLIGNCWLCKCSLVEGDPYQREITGSLICQHCH